MSTHAKWTQLEFPSDAALAEAAAGDLTDRIRQGDLQSLALSGGRIASAFFDALAAASRRRALAWDGVDFFWADERCVPPSDSQSNYREARQRLLDPLRIAAGRVHRIAGELEPAVASAQAEADLRKVTPQLDLVLLGMGEDGHVASLFPGMPTVKADSRSLYLAVQGPKPPAARVTLTYRALAEARDVWVLVAGPSKERALLAAMAGDPAVPLARVLASRPHTRLLVSGSSRATGGQADVARS